MVAQIGGKRPALIVLTFPTQKKYEQQCRGNEVFITGKPRSRAINGITTVMLLLSFTPSSSVRKKHVLRRQPSGNLEILFYCLAVHLDWNVTTDTFRVHLPPSLFYFSAGRSLPLVRRSFHRYEAAEIVNKERNSRMFMFACRLVIFNARCIDSLTTEPGLI